jgi:hypothetical protein
MELQHRAAMSRIGAMERMDKAEIIHAACHAGEKRTDPGAAGAMPVKAPGGAEQIARAGERHAWTVERIRPAMIALQERLVIEGVNVGRAAFHEQEDDTLGPRCMMPRPRRERIEARLRLGGFLGQKRRQSERAEADGALAQHFTAGTNTERRHILSF